MEITWAIFLSCAHPSQQMGWKLMKGEKVPKVWLQKEKRLLQPPARTRRKAITTEKKIKKTPHFWLRISNTAQKGAPPPSQYPKVAVYTTGSAFTAYFKTNLCHFLTRKVVLLIQTLKVKILLLSTINSPGLLWHLRVTFSSNKGKKNLDRK